ncbi:MAG TPA: ABC transporter permease subunit [Burkholderiaceae bacterium]|nr:ABC transporter permease subunit [Burkholderiaceae bacterium]
MANTGPQVAHEYSLGRFEAGRGRLAASLANPWFLLLPALLLLIPCYIAPLGKLFGTSFGDDGLSLAYYRQALGDAGYLSILYRSLVISFQVTVLTVLIGYPLAYGIAKAPPHRQNLLLLLVAIPLWTSTLVRSFAWIILLGREGVLNQMGMALGVQDAPVQMLYQRVAVLTGFVHIMVPYLVFPLVSVMRQIPRGLSSVGMSLGAGPVNAFWLIFFPLSLPGVASGAVLVFVLCTGYFVTPALLGGLGDMTYVMLIQQQVEVTLNWPLAAAMSVILLLVTLFLVLLLGRFMRAGGEGSSHAIAHTARPGKLIAAACALLGRCGARWMRWVPSLQWRPADRHRVSFVGAWGWITIAFLLIPIALLFPLSLSSAPYLQFPPSSLSVRWYANFFARQDWTAAALLSIQVGLAVMLVATAIGTAAAVAFSRLEGRLSRLMYGLLISPLFVPTLVISVALYFAFVPYRLVGTRLGLILGHTLIALPIVVIIVMGSLKRIHLGPERAAMSLGAGRVRAFMATTFVSIRPSIASAALFSFLASFDDVVIALFLSGANSTLTKRMWDGVQLEIDPTIAAVCAMLIMASIAVALSLMWLKRNAAEEPAGA